MKKVPFVRTYLPMSQFLFIKVNIRAMLVFTLHTSSFFSNNIFAMLEHGMLLDLHDWLFVKKNPNQLIFFSQSWSNMGMIIKGENLFRHF